MLLFAFMVQAFMARNMLKNAKDVFIKRLMTRLAMGVRTSYPILLVVH